MPAAQHRQPGRVAQEQPAREDAVDLALDVGEGGFERLPRGGGRGHRHPERPVAERDEHTETVR
jgi:hypothetical protein